MKKKLRESRGETLIEVLASVLIGALSVALLFGAVMASGNLDRLTHDPKVTGGSSFTGGSDDVFYASLDAAEAQATGTGTDKTVTVTGAGTTATIDVKFYGGKGAVSFALPPTGGVTPP